MSTIPESDSSVGPGSLLLGVLDLDSRFRHVNPAWAEWLGVDNADLSGQSVLDYLHPHDRDSAALCLRQARHAPDVVYFSARCRHRDGDYRELQWEVNGLSADPCLYLAAQPPPALPVQPPAPTPELAAALYYAEDAVLVLEPLYHADASLADLLCRLSNPAAARLLQFSSSQLNGQSLLRLWPEMQRGEWLKHYAQVLSSGQAWHSEIHSKRRADHLHLRVQARRVGDRLLLTCRDLSEIHALQQRLQHIVWEQEVLDAELQRIALELDVVIADSAMGVAFLHGRHFDRVSRRFREIFACPPQESLQGKSLRLFYPSLHPYERIEREAAASFGLGRTYCGEWQLRRWDGSLFWCRISAHALNPEDMNNGAVWLFEDVTQQRSIEKELRLVAAAFDNTADGIVITDADTVIQRINPAFTAITGYSQTECIGHKTHILSSGQHDTAFYHSMWDSIKQTGRWQGEIRNRRKDGEIYVCWLSISVIYADSLDGTQFVAVLSDISLLQKDMERTRYLANYDFLTNLPNRFLFHDRINNARILAERRGSSFAILFIDLDDFKPVNDTYGHPAGDELLKCIAVRLKQAVRKSDTVGRHGGDEFTVLITEVTLQAAELFAERLIQAVEQPINVFDHEVRVSASIGLALYPDHGDSVESLLEHADIAMFQAKQLGKGAYCVYTPQPPHLEASTP